MNANTYDRWCTIPSNDRLLENEQCTSYAHAKETSETHPLLRDSRKVVRSASPYPLNGRLQRPIAAQNSQKPQELTDKEGESMEKLRWPLSTIYAQKLPREANERPDRHFEHGEEIAIRCFLEAIRNRTFAMRVAEQGPPSLQEAYSIAI